MTTTFMTKGFLAFILVLVLQLSLFAQHSLMDLIPTNTATHKAVQSGSWFDTLTWQNHVVPDDAAIVHIPMGLNVTYEGQSDAHLFAIRVDGTFMCKQTNTSDTTTITFDTFVGTMMSTIKFHADQSTDGAILVNISPFDINAHKKGTSGFTQLWNQEAKDHYSDTSLHYKVTYEIGPDSRFKTIEAAQAGNTQVVETSRSVISDTSGVLGRYLWDSTQLSLGLITMGQVEIIGQQKSVMAKLGADALKKDQSIQFEAIPVNWNVGDEMVITPGGNINEASNASEVVRIAAKNGTTFDLESKLKKNHKGRSIDNLHCYAGNLSRNITFKSTHPEVITKRGHLMVMHNPMNIQIKNAAFIDMGRTDKSTRTDDLIFEKWVAPKTFNSYISALGQECVQLKTPPAQDIANHRGRYSIHLHRVGMADNGTMAEVIGNVVRGNPGWAITHHDAHADVSENVVYDVVGSGIVSEAGNETGFWDNNLIVNIRKGDDFDDYLSSIFYDHYLFSGQGMGMKGRGVICRGNVIAEANVGVGIVNFNAAINNTLRMNAQQLATLRPDYEFDQFPLSQNGYSVEGDGVMPLEVALILENTTIIWTNRGFSSIERDMGVNHESRSIFTDMKIWGASSGIRITYQNDYSFRNLFISGKNDNSLGLYIWKHAHNHTFDTIKLVDLKYGVTASQLVENTNDNTAKTRNNGVTPWLFVDLDTSNVEHFYGVHTYDKNSTTIYDEHPDNTIHLAKSDLSLTRPITFTLNDSADLEVDLASNDLRFSVDGVITDRIGAYEFGIEQAASMDRLRADYPQRIYEFASASKLEAYIDTFGLYKDTANNDQLYFIINEWVPDRITYEYKSFPIRVNIMNPPATAAYANPQIEPVENFEPVNQLVSRFGTATQSSDASDVFFKGVQIPTPATRALDGNSNGRKNAQFYQYNLLPLGSSAITQEENEPWWELDLGEEKIIEYIDVWNTVDMHGQDIETPGTHFHDFYVMIGDQPFGNVSLATAQANAIVSYYKNQDITRLFSINDINTKGRYIRIQAVGTNKIGLAEVDVIGRTVSEQADCFGDIGGTAYLDNCDECVMGNTGKLPCALNENYEWTLAASPSLPAELITFTGRLIEDYTLLEWATALEENVLGYELLRSSDAKNWEKLTFVYANNRPSNYHHKDLWPLNGKSYYRLKIIDLDGTVIYSNVVSIQRDRLSTLNLYPNPSGGRIYVDLELAINSSIHFEIVDVLGKVLETQTLESTFGGRTGCFFDLDQLPSGTYFLKYIDQGKPGCTVFILE